MPPPGLNPGDNGLSFTSSEFESYMAEIGVKHKRITPLWPQANSEAEKFEQIDWKKGLYTFLLNYRATPHLTTGYPPSELLFNRSARTKVPQTVTMHDSQIDSVVRSKDEQANSKMTQYADVKRKAIHTVIQVGDRVLLRQRKQNKFSTNFDPKPFRVTRKRGTMITAFRNGKYVTHNSSLFKKVNLKLFEGEGEESDEDDDDSNTENDLNDRNETRAQNSDQNNRRNEEVQEGMQDEIAKVIDLCYILYVLHILLCDHVIHHMPCLSVSAICYCVIVYKEKSI